MEKLDLKKQLKHLYAATAKQPRIVDVPAMNYLMIDGQGDPESSPQFQDAIAALYGVSYTMKFALKKSDGRDWTVMGLEGLWWAEGTDQFSMDRKDTWRWTLMVVQPDFVTDELVRPTAEELRKKKGLDAFSRLRVERYHEGLSAQVLHVGPYAEVPATVARLHDFIREQGCRPRGKHHEIYMSDPRRVAPEKLKTIIRQPIAR